MRSRACLEVPWKQSTSDRYSAHNYEPLPVVLARGKALSLGHQRAALRRLMSAYSAASHGHGHPRILAALTAQAALAMPSRALQRSPRAVSRRAVRTDRPRRRAADEHRRGGGRDRIKAARRWGYRVKGIARDAPRSSSRPAISTAAPRPSSPSPRKRITATASARPPRASAPYRSAISPRSSVRSHPRRQRC